MRYLSTILLCFITVSLAQPSTERALSIVAQTGLEDFRELSPKPVRWESLMPADYIPSPQLFIFEVGPDETLMQEAITETPLVQEFDNVAITVPGYVVPLEGDEEQVTEFLLVPYFGACIHVPPPPVNQTIYVKTRYPLLVDESWDIITVAGVLQAESATSDFGAAGYSITDAFVIPFDAEEYDSLKVIDFAEGEEVERVIPEPNTESTTEAPALDEAELLADYQGIVWENLVPVGAPLTPQVSRLCETTLLDEATRADFEAAQEAVGDGVTLVKELNELDIAITGFFYPLEYDNNDISSFLLLSHLEGVCNTLPAPSVQETIYVKPAQALSWGEVSDIMNVAGTLQVGAFVHEQAIAGYSIVDALVFPR